MTRFRELSTRRKIAVVLLGAAVLSVALLAAGMAFLNFGHGSDQNAVQAQNPGQGFAPWPSTEYEIKAAMLLNFAGFVKQGGAIGFSTAGGRVRFEINTGAARDAGLEINPRLLQLSPPAR